MAFLQLTYSSAALQMNTSVRIVLPDTGDLSEVNTIYLLHGLTDNCTGWTRYTACELYAREHNAALIMPEVQRSFYIDGVHGLKYFTYVSQELPQAMHRMFGLSQSREKNYVMGLSMGGYGALKCAMTYPQNYAGAASFSGVCDADSFFHQVSQGNMDRELPALLGESRILGAENDLFCLLDHCPDLPPIYMACGEQDPMYPMNQALAKALQEKGCTFQFDHRPGDHCWRFWNQAFQDALSYFFE